MISVYLAGAINSDTMEQCIQWRVKLRADLGDKIAFFDPTFGENMKKVDSIGCSSELSPKEIVTKDYEQVKRCDILAVNLNSFGAHRPITGTLFEMAWAYEFRKPIITLANEDHYRFHPFIVESSTKLVGSVEEMEKVLHFYTRCITPQTNLEVGR